MTQHGFDLLLKSPGAQRKIGIGWSELKGEDLLIRRLIRTNLIKSVPLFLIESGRRNLILITPPACNLA